jgi:hypothetical protein
VCDWLAVITRINPFTCAVDPLRHLVFALLDMPAAAAARFAAGVSCSDTHCRLPQADARWLATAVERASSRFGSRVGLQPDGLLALRPGAS